MSSYRVTIVDDEQSNLDSLQRILRSDGAEVSSYLDPREALLQMGKGGTDVLITDLRMNNWNGLELLEATKLLDPSIEVVLVTAYGTVEVAVEAMKKGAYDFVIKPLQRLQVLRAVHRALEKRRLVLENRDLREELGNLNEPSGREIIGKSEALRSVLEVARQAARSRANVLIDGESGTGKGLLAEWLHRESGPDKGLLVKINCANIPDNLLEAELFGYEAGAFTGAMKRKKGRVELAHKGSLFLDEIGITPPTFQGKLLRLLQEGEFERLGGMETIHVDARVITATNTDLKDAIEKGLFREDLFYRLNVIHVSMPPLRSRPEDIPLLVTRFVEESAIKNGRAVLPVDAEAMELFEAYAWPGNIRELQNLMERLVVLNRSGRIRAEDLPAEIGGTRAGRSIVVPLGLSLRQVERILFSETLKSTKGDKKLTAKLLGVHPRTIYRFLETVPEPIEGSLPEVVPAQEEVAVEDVAV